MTLLALVVELLLLPLLLQLLHTVTTTTQSTILLLLVVLLLPLPQPLLSPATTENAPSNSTTTIGNITFLPD